MALIIRGKILAVRPVNGQKKLATLHFLAVDADGNGRVDIVHPNKGFDASHYHIGQEIELSVAPEYNRKTKQIEFVILDEAVEQLDRMAA